jgi:hypothetical protein
MRYEIEIKPSCKERMVLENAIRKKIELIIENILNH